MNDKSQISSDIQYLGAWNELNMRTNARDQVLTIQLSVSAGLLAAAFSEKKFTEAALIVPYLSLILVSMQCHHDWVCRLLSDCLRNSAEDSPDDWWNRTNERVGETVLAGLLHTFASILGVLLTGGVALVLTRAEFRGNIVGRIGWVALGLTVVLLIVARMYRLGFRNKPNKLQ
jgi:hypothetical protein